MPVFNGRLTLFYNGAPTPMNQMQPADDIGAILEREKYSKPVPQDRFLLKYWSVVSRNHPKKSSAMLAATRAAEARTESRARCA